ncbi:hypothetical protein SO802_007382 [Lithocarpus litseifolius]|uniref:C2 domain-containing protein n=1 Tax=Lithocarpus litseifolius TaxID=425828 RepID=A0AAW2DQ63_9ROSI
MSYRPLELVIMSAQGLKKVNRLTKMKPYAVVFIRDHNNTLHSHKRKTSVDSKGGSNPIWSFNVKFTINLAIAQDDHLDLVVKLKSRRKTHGCRDKDIGEVRVLISDLLICFGDDDGAAEKHTTRDIVTSDGEKQGALAFSYKFGRTVDHPPLDPNVKQRPKRGTGFLGKIAEGFGEGLGSGLAAAAVGAGVMIFGRDDGDDEQPDDDGDDEQPDDDDDDDEHP